MVLQTLLTKIKERNFRGIAKQTEQLDTQTRQHLQEFLQVVPAEQEELEDLQEELYDASVRLHDLQEKEDFIGVRLQSYQSQLKQIAKGNSSSISDDDDHDNDNGDDTNPPPVTTTSEAEVSEDDESPSAAADNEAAATTINTNNTMGATTKQDEHRQALAKIQAVHNTMKQNIKVLEKKIATMEKRKLELQFHLEECQVVLKASKQMEQLETELAAEQAVEQLTIAVDNGEVGQIEIVDLQAAKKLKEENDKAAHQTTITTRIQNKDGVVSEEVLASRIAIADGDSDAK